ncbi:Retrovirus-related Pol polyprotein [Stylophora pistillata]|uniref:Retrovirus-related Pol polyprotein n=1 Tax=Stylophora pistillata TaxID=50429 RepID=A0A2B4RA95_STYPI|nr:Retrovirus-related Pol polyprotein [Stylophora pistillata]
MHLTVPQAGSYLRRAILSASHHTPSALQKRIILISRECLAIVSCMEKCYHYLYGKRDITVHSDHQPLETIYKKPLSRTPRRLQGMMLRLQNYQFTVQYMKGKELFVADTLSCAPLSGGTHSPSRMMQDYDVFRVNLIQMDLSSNLVKPGTMNQIRKETEKDPSLMTLNNMVLDGWPHQKSEVPEEIRAYWDVRDEISVYDGVLFKSHQVIVPASLRPELLQKIHKAHQGANISIRRARESVYCPGMQAVIRQTCSLCGNGEAASSVKISKNILTKSRFEDPYLALLAYQNTPQQGYQYSPAQRLMSQKLQDIILTAASQQLPQTASG